MWWWAEAREAAECPMTQDGPPPTSPAPRLGSPAPRNLGSAPVDRQPGPQPESGAQNSRTQQKWWVGPLAWGAWVGVCSAWREGSEPWGSPSAPVCQA